MRCPGKAAVGCWEYSGEEEVGKKRKKKLGITTSITGYLSTMGAEEEGNKDHDHDQNHRRDHAHKHRNSK